MPETVDSKTKKFKNKDHFTIRLEEAKGCIECVLLDVARPRILFYDYEDVADGLAAQTIFSFHRSIS